MPGLPSHRKGDRRDYITLAPGFDREHVPERYKLPGKGTEQKSAVRWTSYEKRLIAKLDPISVPGQVVLLAGVSI